MPVLLAGAPIHRRHAFRKVRKLTSPCSWVTAVLWLRASCSPMVHTCCGSRFSYSLSVLLSNLCPAVVLVLYGLRHRSSHVCKNPTAFLLLVSAQDSMVDYARTNDCSAITKRPSLATWYHHSVHPSSLAFSLEQSSHSILPCNYHPPRMVGT